MKYGNLSGGIASTDLTMTLDGTRTMKEAPNSSTKAKSFQSRISAFSLASAVGPRPACSPAATRRPRHAPVVAIANTHHERHFATQQPHRPESERPQQPPPCACGRRAVRAAVCGVWRSSAHTNTQLAPPRWLCGQCPSSARRWGACPWMWLCGRWRRCAEARRRRDAVVRQERRTSR